MLLRVLVLLAGRLWAADSPSPLQPTEILNAQLPEWMRFKGEYRARFEDQEHMRWRPANSDRYLLSRVRLGLTLKPLWWVTMYGQMQDARILFPRKSAHGPPVQDSLDLRQAYLQLGDAEKSWIHLRVGRQELTYGEERMLGVSNWNNIGRAFNAVKLTLRAEHLGGLKLDTFASSVVVPREALWDGSQPGDNLHGAYGVFDKLLAGGTVEPYFYWRLSPSVVMEQGGRGKLNLGSLGLRVTKKFGPKWYASSDTIFQEGSHGTDSVRAWAAYWRVRRSLSQKGWKPSLTGDCNLATGDKDPRDGHFQTFDVLYPTPHDKYGLADQVGWRNIRHVGATLEVAPLKKLTLQGKFHSWWLHSATDGLYIAGGSLQQRDLTGRSGRHVGEEVDFQFMWTPDKTTQVAGGVGHIFSGEFLRKTSPARPYTFIYLSITKVL